MEKKESGGVQAVDRALILLQLIAKAPKPISIPDLCAATGMNRTTVWRLLSALESRGFAEKDAITKGYQLGYSATSLCTSATQQYAPLIRLSRPVMEGLWEQSQETVILSVPRHDGILTIDQIDSPQTIRLKNYMDDVAPLHCSSNGKVMLSCLPLGELEEFLRTPLPPHTPKSITDPRLLGEEVHRTRENGFGMVLGEYDENENGLSAPVFHNGTLAAVVNICGPAFRFTEELMLQWGPRLAKACREISRRLERAEYGGGSKENQ